MLWGVREFEQGWGGF